MTFEEKCNACALEAAKFIERIKKIDLNLKAMVIVDDGEISITSCTNPTNLAENLGLLKVTEIRLEYKEREIFNRRVYVQEQIDQMKEQPQQFKVKKEDVN